MNVKGNEISYEKGCLNKITISKLLAVLFLLTVVSQVSTCFLSGVNLRPRRQVENMVN